MSRKNNFKSLQLVFLLIFWKRCDSQVNREEVDKPPDSLGGDGGAFFALRSCHQLLLGDSGEFFSPDYLCSNPPLWCNWTIQVDPGKRIHLHLEDLTPDDACHLKQDQVHVDEPAGRFTGHKVLEKCWREAKFTSSSNTLYVVLLIGSWPSAPYRGFYGRYQAFGPPVVYNPQAERNRKSEPPPGLTDLSDSVMNGEQVPELPSSAGSDHMFDYYDQPSALTGEEEEDAATVDENLHPASENHSHVLPFTAEPTASASTQETSRLGRGAAESAQSDPVVHPELKPSARTPTAVRRNVEEAPTHPEAELSTRSRSEVKENRTGVSEASDHLPSSSSSSPSEAPGPEEAEQTHPHPSMVEPLSDHRGSLNMRNHSEIPHLPGDHLFEAAVEVQFHVSEESWDDEARSLLSSVMALISERLEDLHTPPLMSPKRMKRLYAGVLYILWLQIGRGPGDQQVRRVVKAALHGLTATSISIRGNNREKAVILSVSHADVNECGTQLVLCDINADCMNRFGSYSCRCRPGFRDESRLGSGGTVCVDVKEAGCGSGPSAETKGVYVLFFLLSFLILTLLAAAGALYHRHHRGAFLVQCHSDISPPDPNNSHHLHRYDDSYSSPADSDLPPPPPPLPARGFREGWPQVKERCPAVDLPLLRFSPLLPPDGCMEPQEGGRK